ncbi:MAG: hypothetical protein U0821_19275 [Chloroflexota bacterium]
MSQAIEELLLAPDPIAHAKSTEMRLDGDSVRIEFLTIGFGVMTDAELTREFSARDPRRLDGASSAGDVFSAWMPAPSLCRLGRDPRIAWVQVANGPKPH